MEVNKMFCNKLQKPEKLLSLWLFIDHESKIELHYLPPLTLNFEFPADYPSVSPPIFRLSCKWLNRYQVGCLYLIRFANYS